MSVASTTNFNYGGSSGYELTKDQKPFEKEITDLGSRFKDKKVTIMERLVAGAKIPKECTIENLFQGVLKGTGYRNQIEIPQKMPNVKPTDRDIESEIKILKSFASVLFKEKKDDYFDQKIAETLVKIRTDLEEELKKQDTSKK